MKKNWDAFEFYCIFRQIWVTPTLDILSRTARDYTWLPVTTRDCTWLHATTRDFTWLHVTTRDNTWLHVTARDYTWLHVTVRDCTWLHVTARDYTWLHMTIRNCTWLHMTSSRFLSKLLSFNFQVLCLARSSRPFKLQSSGVGFPPQFPLG